MPLNRGKKSKYREQTITPASLVLLTLLHIWFQFAGIYCRFKQFSVIR